MLRRDFIKWVGVVPFIKKLPVTPSKYKLNELYISYEAMKDIRNWSVNSVEDKFKEE